ncbi:MAG: peroxiredoxin [Verrucomicrobiales bacterium VVV1]|nr:MAG: peroxiredoxin [Verrucomicrobiales bacterium VVV1]
MKPQPGQKAPDFTATVVGDGYAEGAAVTLSKLLGKKVVLVFYPKDDTPGCTTQACEIRDSWADLKDRALIFGVWGEKSMYGKTYLGTERTTFIIGEDGKIDQILEKVSPKEHLALLTAALE